MNDEEPSVRHKLLGPEHAERMVAPESVALEEEVVGVTLRPRSFEIQNPDPNTVFLSVGSKLTTTLTASASVTYVGFCRP